MERQVAQCPFLKQLCIKDRCELFGQVQIAAPGPLAGSMRVGTMSGCVFNLIAIVLNQGSAAGPPGPAGPGPRQN